MKSSIRPLLPIKIENRLVPKEHSDASSGTREQIPSNQLSNNRYQSYEERLQSERPQNLKRLLTQPDLQKGIKVTIRRSDSALSNRSNTSQSSESNLYMNKEAINPTYSTPQHNKNSQYYYINRNQTINNISNNHITGSPQHIMLTPKASSDIMTSQYYNQMQYKINNGIRKLQQLDRKLSVYDYKNVQMPASNLNTSRGSASLNNKSTYNNNGYSYANNSTNNIISNNSTILGTPVIAKKQSLKPQQKHTKFTINTVSANIITPDKYGNSSSYANSYGNRIVLPVQTINGKIYNSNDKNNNTNNDNIQNSPSQSYSIVGGSSKCSYTYIYANGRVSTKNNNYENQNIKPQPTENNNNITNNTILRSNSNNIYINSKLQKKTSERQSSTPTTPTSKHNNYNMDSNNNFFYSLNNNDSIAESRVLQTPSSLHNSPVSNRSFFLSSQPIYQNNDVSNTITNNISNVNINQINFSNNSSTNNINKNVQNQSTFKKQQYLQQILNKSKKIRQLQGIISQKDKKIIQHQGQSRILNIKLSRLQQQNKKQSQEEQFCRQTITKISEQLNNQKRMLQKIIQQNIAQKSTLQRQIELKLNSKANQQISTIKRQFQEKQSNLLKEIRRLNQQRQVYFVGMSKQFEGKLFREKQYYESVLRQLNQQNSNNIAKLKQQSKNQKVTIKNQLIKQAQKYRQQDKKQIKQLVERTQVLQNQNKILQKKIEDSNMQLGRKQRQLQMGNKILEQVKQNNKNQKIKLQARIKQVENVRYSFEGEIKKLKDNMIQLTHQLQNKNISIQEVNRQLIISKTLKQQYQNKLTKMQLNYQQLKVIQKKYQQLKIVQQKYEQLKIIQQKNRQQGNKRQELAKMVEQMEKKLRSEEQRRVKTEQKNKQLTQKLQQQRMGKQKQKQRNSKQMSKLNQQFICKQKLILQQLNLLKNKLAQNQNLCKKTEESKYYQLSNQINLYKLYFNKMFQQIQDLFMIVEQNMTKQGNQQQVENKLLKKQHITDDVQKLSSIATQLIKSTQNNILKIYKDYNEFQILSTNQYKNISLKQDKNKNEINSKVLQVLLKNNNTTKKSGMIEKNQQTQKAKKPIKQKQGNLTSISDCQNTTQAEQRIQNLKYQIHLQQEQLFQKQNVIEVMENCIQDYKNMIMQMKNKVQIQQTVQIQYHQILDFFQIDARKPSQQAHEQLLQIITDFTKKLEKMVQTVNQLQVQLIKKQQQNQSLKDKKKRMIKQLKKCQQMIQKACIQNEQLQSKVHEMQEKFEKGNMLVKQLIKMNNQNSQQIIKSHFAIMNFKYYRLMQQQSQNDQDYENYSDQNQKNEDKKIQDQQTTGIQRTKSPSGNKRRNSQSPYMLFSQSKINIFRNLDQLSRNKQNSKNKQKFSKNKLFQLTQQVRIFQSQDKANNSQLLGEQKYEKQVIFG